jgi:periplasmic divalent cation tolerance protein
MGELPEVKAPRGLLRFAPMNDPVLIVWCSCPDRPVAERIAHALVERGLAACVTELPGARSVYRWQGAVESAEELVLMIKTRAGKLEALKLAVIELHPYDLPEIIAVEVTDGHAPYLDWVRTETP